MAETEAYEPVEGDGRFWVECNDCDARLLVRQTVTLPGHRCTQRQEARRKRLASGDHPTPEPCPRCGWQYDEATLDHARRGLTRLDPLPTHRCIPCGGESS